MADPTTNLRVRISADINDIKQGLALVQSRLADVRKDATKPLPTNNAVQQLGVSAGQTAAAMRQLPAQFTDIVTSLQGGMPFFTVLLQQGGQIKDSFGGTKEALAGVSSALLGMVNPLTLTAVAVGAVAVAWKQGADEATAFEQAVIKSGNAAGISAQGLAELAAEMDDMAGVTKSSAAAALAEVASTGQFTGEQLRQVAQAAEAWNVATGAAIEDTVAQFVRLRKDPVDALLALNEQLHFLTQAQLDNVIALKEQGRETDAATAAIKAYADTLGSRSQDIQENLGFLEKGWRAVKNAALEGWDALLGIGRVDTATDKIKTLQQYLKDLEAGTGIYRNMADSARPALAKQFRDQIAALQAQAEGLKRGSGAGTTGTVDSDVAKATLAFHERTNQLLDQQLGLEGQIKKMREDAAKQGITDAALLDAREKAMRATAAKKAARGVDGAERSAGLQALRDEEDRDKAERAAATRVLQAQYQARELTVEEYYARLRTLTEQGTDAEIASLQKQIEFLKQQGAAGKDAIAVGKQVATLESKLAQVRTEGAAAQQQLTTQESAAVKARTSAIASYTTALDASTGALRAQMDAAVARVGSGDREYEIEQRVNDVLRERAERLNDLTLQKNAGQIDQTTFDAELAAVQAATDERVRIIRDGYQQLDEAQADWSNGAKAAWANYAQDAANTAGQVEQAMGSAFSGLEDIWVDFVTTGKASFSDFAESVLADLARILAKQALVQIGQSVATAFGYAQGGYTGPGGKYEPAGIVHRGEVVWSQADVARAGGVGVVEGMRRGLVGYADGGVVGGVVGGVAAASGAPVIQISQEINIEADGSSSTDTSARDQSAVGKALADQMAQVAVGVIVRERRPGGLLAGVRNG